MEVKDTGSTYFLDLNGNFNLLKKELDAFEEGQGDEDGQSIMEMERTDWKGLLQASPSSSPELKQILGTPGQLPPLNPTASTSSSPVGPPNPPTFAPGVPTAGKWLPVWSWVSDPPMFWQSPVPETATEPTPWHSFRPIVLQTPVEHLTQPAHLPRPLPTKLDHFNLVEL